MKRLSDQHGPFTGKRRNGSAKRLEDEKKCRRLSPTVAKHAQTIRENSLTDMLSRGPAWEADGLLPVYAARTPSTNKKWQKGSRAGSKRIRRMEEDLTNEEPLTPRMPPCSARWLQGPITWPKIGPSVRSARKSSAEKSQCPRPGRTSV